MQGMKAWLADKQPSFVGILQSLKTTKTTDGMIPLTKRQVELSFKDMYQWTASNLGP